MIEAFTADVTLPRWIVWAALLTRPAYWSQRISSIASEKLSLGGNNGN
jgi:hypothetical protein